MKEITQQCMLKVVCECNRSSEYNSEKYENNDKIIQNNSTDYDNDAIACKHMHQWMGHKCGLLVSTI
jgi:hypothetical protein